MTMNIRHNHTTPHRFQQVTGEFASAAGVPLEDVVGENGFLYDESRFWLRHYGDDDPEGVTVMMHLDEVPEAPGDVVAITRPLLQYHAVVPAVAHGYYGYLPRFNCLVYCVRLPLDQVRDGVEAIAGAIAALAARRREADSAAAL